ncbi:hypothetical protein [Hoeflea phototrophica]|jgi:hypothetical protein|uniref:hypothetical protein n=1 Tax=Hoeflea phototrophica TaxID=244596 RepID=UPI0012EB4373|nr:hypothetical protein [Hoeflea phototrophica]
MKKSYLENDPGVLRGAGAICLATSLATSLAAARLSFCYWPLNGGLIAASADDLTRFFARTHKNARLFDRWCEGSAREKKRIFLERLSALVPISALSQSTVAIGKRPAGGKNPKPKVAEMLCGEAYRLSSN